MSTRATRRQHSSVERGKKDRSTDPVATIDVATRRLNPLECVCVHVTKPVLIQPRELSHFRLPNSIRLLLSPPHRPACRLAIYDWFRFHRCGINPPTCVDHHVQRRRRALHLNLYLLREGRQRMDGWLPLLEITNYARQVPRKRNVEQIVFSRNAH